MKDIDFDALFKKVEELRAVFILGQRLIPFLEDVFELVYEIKPLLDEINLSMEENVSKTKIASMQLSQVTEATEMAIGKVIEIINGLINKCGNILSNMNRLNELYLIRHDNVIKVLENIYKAANDKKDINKYMPQLSDIIDQLKKAESDDYKEIYDSTGELLNSIVNDSHSMMMSLQVQDITSQKIAAANYLIETINEKIGNILMKFQSTKTCSFVEKDKNDSISFISTLHRPIGFNPEDADIVTPKDDHYSSRDDIEALFGTAKS
ncbi:MAG TPA: hypothetical protein VMT12_11115 [Syntrophales bacterium]|nr:hypothetical protein [Syntrophales bacterium]